MIGFIPSHLLPKRCPCSLDTFLHPHVRDVGDIFINGKLEALINMYLTSAFFCFFVFAAVKKFFCP